MTNVDKNKQTKAENDGKLLDIQPIFVSTHIIIKDVLANKVLLNSRG